MTTYIFRWDRHGRKGQRWAAAAKKTIERSLSRRSYAEWMIIFRPARLLLNAALVVWLGYKAVRRLVEIGLKAKN